MRDFRISVLIGMLLMTQSLLQAQVVHAGGWTGYLDGISVSNMIVRDSVLYVTTFRGTARVNPVTYEYTYLAESGNPGLPAVINLKYSVIDAEGRLWFFLEHQLVHLDPDMTLHVAAPEPKYLVTAMRMDREDNLWVGFYTPYIPPSTGEAIARFNGTDWDYIDVGVEALNVLDIAFDPDNKPWLCAGYKMYRFNGTSYEVVKNNGSPVICGTRLAISQDGHVATAGAFNTGRLTYYSNGTWKTVDDQNYAYPVYDEHNTLWVNDRAGNVYTIDADDTAPRKVLTTAANFRTGEDEYITGLGFDGQGALWMGKTIGLFTAPDTIADQWDFVPLTNLLVPGPHPEIAASGDTAWLLTDAGITKRVHDSFEKLTIPQEGITDLFYDEFRKGLWVSSPGKLGFYQGDIHFFININPLVRDSTYHNEIVQVTGDKLGNIWLLGYDGLLRYSLQGQWKSFFQGVELPHAPVGFGDITFSYADQSLWIRIRGFSTKTFTDPPKMMKIEGDVATQIDIDTDLLTNYSIFGVVADSLLWFSHASNAVVRYENGAITEYNPGPLNAEEFIIYNDSTVLLCSNLGLYIYAHDQWVKPVIPSDQIANDDALPACLTADGRLYLANYPLLLIEDLDALLDGLVTSTGTTLQSSLHYYPNPVTDYLYLDQDFATSCDNCTAELISPGGDILKKIAAPLNGRIDLRELSPGLYVLRIYSGSNLMYALKVIRQ